MPNSLVKSFAKRTSQSVERVEYLWDKAKKIAADAERPEDYAYIVGILKKSLGMLPKESLACEVLSMFEETPNIDPKELKMGLEIEKEHNDAIKAIKDSITDGKITLSDSEIIEIIARAHLKEIPDYYTRLNKMEKDAK